MAKEYPSNSNKKRDGKPQIPTREKRPEKKESKKLDESVVDRVVPRADVNPRVRKENFIQRTTKSIFGADPDGVVSYVLWDVLIPAAKETVQDMVTQGIEMFLFPGSGRGRRSKRSNNRGSSGVVSYGNMYRNERYTHKGNPPWERSSSKERPSISNRARASRSSRSRLDAVVFGTVSEAQQVLGIMSEILEKYGEVTVADFYDIAGLENHAQATDNAWGWYNLENTSISRSRDGFEISFPKSQQLER